MKRIVAAALFAVMALAACSSAAAPTPIIIYVTPVPSVALAISTPTPTATQTPTATRSSTTTPTPAPPFTVADMEAADSCLRHEAIATTHTVDRALDECADMIKRVSVYGAGQLLANYPCHTFYESRYYHLGYGSSEALTMATDRCP
jgi:hypothetical protein